MVDAGWWVECGMIYELTDQEREQVLAARKERESAKRPECVPNHRTSFDVDDVAEVLDGLPLKDGSGVLCRQQAVKMLKEYAAWLRDTTRRSTNSEK